MATHAPGSCTGMYKSISRVQLSCDSVVRETRVSAAVTVAASNIRSMAISDGMIPRSLSRSIA